MRIVGGTLKGRSLAAPSGAATRPTSDRVREAIFNILAHGIPGFSFENARVLDLFAGTGALGFEALSRGAKFCLFIDDSAEARGLIRRNADALGVIGRCKIWRRDAANLGRNQPQPPYDLVFADPPYGKGLGEKALAELVDGGWIGEDSIVVLEESERSEVPRPPGLVEFDKRGYGDTAVRFYRPNNRSISESLSSIQVGRP
jgi:16S rRNA (guanine966-N2)-methyltransferase